MSAQPMPDRQRLRALRMGLPRQACHVRLAKAALLFGPLYPAGVLQRHIARTLPWRFGLVRRVKLTTIERAEIVIPDHVLLRYDDAIDLGVFGYVLVAHPAYYWRARGAPWLVAAVAGTQQWAVIARWSE